MFPQRDAGSTWAKAESTPIESADQRFFDSRDDCETRFATENATFSMENKTQLP
jgi:hypothetical protein